MSIQINIERLNTAHEAFKQYVFEQEGVRFANFQHPFLVKSEIKYKWAVYDEATEKLNLKKWDQWRKTPGKIIESVKLACKSSENLLDHKHGPKGYSETALYRTETIDQINIFEDHLYLLFNSNQNNMHEFAEHFGELVNYVRQQKLGCKWDFLSYLAFLYNPQMFFPIRPTRFDSLLNFYGINDIKISRTVSWEKYSILLDFFDVLRSHLSLYGNIDTIQLHSYLWVISHLIKTNYIANYNKAEIREVYPDFNSELKNRSSKAGERERIGILGEEFVYEKEIQKLEAAGRSDLAKCVKMVSFKNDGSGYDILSFNQDGTELHIEVKTTIRTIDYDSGFWLSDNEKAQAEEDQLWVIYRVWSADSSPHFKNIGNVVREQSLAWKLRSSTWFVEQCR